MIISLRAASTRIFSRARNGIPNMASIFLSGATVNVTGFLDVQDFEGIMILETSFSFTITPWGPGVGGGGLGAPELEGLGVFVRLNRFDVEQMNVAPVAGTAWIGV